MGSRNYSSILLCGLPRSGTTMCCQLLNQFKNTVALHEPIAPDSFSGSRRAAVEVIKDFSRKARGQALTSGTVPSKLRDGKIPSNPVSSGVGGDRKEIVSPGTLQVSMQLDDDFRLVIKHNALFAVLFDELVNEFPFYALVRNPLPVIASWRSVQLPVGDGRLPMAERFDTELRQALDEEADLLERQLKILSWFFDIFRRLHQDRVLSYEALVQSNGQILQKISGLPMSQPAELRSQFKNAGLGHREIELLATTLVKRSQIYDGFYTREDIESAAQEMIM